MVTVVTLSLLRPLFRAPFLLPEVEYTLLTESNTAWRWDAPLEPLMQWMWASLFPAFPGLDTLSNPQYGLSHHYWKSAPPEVYGSIHTLPSDRVTNLCFPCASPTSRVHFSQQENNNTRREVGGTNSIAPPPHQNLLRQQHPQDLEEASPPLQGQGTTSARYCLMRPYQGPPMYVTAYCPLRHSPPPRNGIPHWILWMNQRHCQFIPVPIYLPIFRFRGTNVHVTMENHTVRQHPDPTCWRYLPKEAIICHAYMVTIG